MVTHEDILKIARLAKLYVSPKELDGLTKDLNQMIAFTDTINTAAAKANDFDNINGLENAFRKDEPAPSFGRDEILKNAKKLRGRIFSRTAPRIGER